MAEKSMFYKCEVCGNVVSVIDAGDGALVCCGKDMILLKEQTTADEGPKEKHVPIIVVDGEKVTVKVGEVEHPMEDGHYISLIQLVNEKGIAQGKRLKPGDKPEAVFEMEDTKGLKARILCNLHGVWISSCSDNTCDF